jgi:hypothetical protein
VAASALALAICTVFAWVALPRPASADSLHVDWWTRDATVTAPSGGFAVAADVDGATAVAAVRIRIDQAVNGAVLLAPPAHIDPATAIVACPAATGWADAQGGDLGSAPKADCARASAPFTASGDRWRADLRGLIGNDPGTYGIVLLPAPGPLARAGVAVGVDVARFKSAFASPALDVTVPAPGAALPAATPSAEPSPVPPVAAPGPDLHQTVAADTALPSVLSPDLGQAASIAPVPSAGAAPSTARPRIALPITRTADRLTAGGALWRIVVAILGGVLAAFAHSKRDALSRRWDQVRAALPSGPRF